MCFLDFLECIEKTLVQGKFTSDSIIYLKDDTQGIIDSVLAFASGEPDGQLRSDCKLRRFNLASFRFGSKNDQISDEEFKKKKGTKVTDIHLGSHTEIYTIVGKFYIEMMNEILKQKSMEKVWFIPALVYDKWKLFDATVETTLAVLDACWRSVYEFYLVPKDFSWLVHYEHHHNIYFLGNEIANAATNRWDRRRWKDKILNHAFFPADTKK